MEVLLAPEGGRIPLSLPRDDGAFDHAIPREGWVAVQIAEHVVSLRDGRWLEPVSLGDSWGMAPAADPDLLIVRRRDEENRDGDLTVEAIDGDGVVRRQLTAPDAYAYGELRDEGLVGAREIIGWDGERRPAPWPGAACAVTGGRFVLARDDETGAVTLYDARAATVAAECTPPGHLLLLAGGYDATGRSVAFNGWNEPWALVAGEAFGVWVVDVGFAQHSAVWLDPERLLFIGERDHLVVDITSGERTALHGVPKEARVRVDVTGRFDLAVVEAAARPWRAGPIEAQERDGILAAAETWMASAAQEAGLGAEVAARAVPAVWIRSCPARRFPVGASRFGGRPDLPDGYPWPQLNGIPMAFLAQLRLDELRAALPSDAPPVGLELPEEGLLVVFAGVDPDDPLLIGLDGIGHLAIVDGDELRRRSWPARLPGEARLAASVAAPEPMLSPPNRHALSDDMFDAEVQRFLDAVRPPGALHQCLGHPSTVQDPVGGGAYRHLLRLDSDPLNGTRYGDGGSLQITVPADLPLGDALAAAELTIDST